MEPMHGLHMCIEPAPAAVAPSPVVLHTRFWFHASVVVLFFSLGSGFPFSSRASGFVLGLRFGPCFSFSSCFSSGLQLWSMLQFWLFLFWSPFAVLATFSRSL